MERTCAKCGFLNTAASGGELEICPKCGVIYVRAAAQAALSAQRQAVKSKQQEDAKTSVLGIIGLVVEVVAWVCALAGACSAAFLLSSGLEEAQSAPQQAAVAAMAGAYAVIPYCIARGIQQLRRIQA